MRMFAFAVLTVLLTASSSWAAGLVARVDISRQTMTVYMDGEAAYSWKVSTGGKGHRTPTGSYGPKRLHRMWYSSKYENAPMPYSVFFRGGYAVHGTNHVRSLGRPVSHGCVRLHPRHARTLYNLVKAYGKANSRIIVQH